ncbi:PqqD family protein [Butyricicoccus sp.]|uniref:PqqD family protein n=1 Tax=Butyricicoccus sp. TaxID=2049021 RepID=UPI003F167F92
MKATKDMILREVAGEHILVPTGEAAIQFQGVITLNDSGLLLWNRLQEDCTEAQLVDAVLEEYEIDAETAAADVRKFLEQMKQAGILLEQ